MYEKIPIFSKPNELNSLTWQMPYQIFARSVLLENRSSNVWFMFAAIVAVFVNKDTQWSWMCHILRPLKGGTPWSSTSLRRFNWKFCVSWNQWISWPWGGPVDFLPNTRTMNTSGDICLHIITNFHLLYPTGAINGTNLVQSYPGSTSPQFKALQNWVFYSRTVVADSGPLFAQMVACTQNVFIAR